MVQVRKSLFILILLCLFSNFVIVAEEGNSSSEETTVTEVQTDSYFSDYYSSSNSQESSKKNKSSTAGYLIKMIIVLVIVIGLIYGVLWFIKKKTNVVKSEDDYLRRAAYIDIAPGKSVEVITLLDKGYLIGVTDDKITLLGEIDDKELISAMNVNADKKQPVKKPVNFNEVLEMLTQKGGKSKNAFSDSESKIDNLFSKK